MCLYNTLTLYSVLVDCGGGGVGIVMDGVRDGWELDGNLTFSWGGVGEYAEDLLPTFMPRDDVDDYGDGG